MLSTRPGDVKWLGGRVGGPRGRSAGLRRACRRATRGRGAAASGADAARGVNVPAPMAAAGATGQSPDRRATPARLFAEICRRGPVARAQLRHATGLSTSTVSAVVGDLQAAGLVA